MKTSWRFLSIALALCFLLSPLSVSAQTSAQGLACVHPMKGTPQKLTEATLENGLDAVAFDLDGDKKPDAATYTPPGGKAPLFYEVDTDKDNEPDLLYIDTKWNGECDSIKLYRDYNAPGHAHSPSEVPKTYMEGM